MTSPPPSAVCLEAGAARVLTSGVVDTAVHTDQCALTPSQDAPGLAPEKPDVDDGCTLVVLGPSGHPPAVLANEPDLQDSGEVRVVSQPHILLWCSWPANVLKEYSHAN